MGEVLSFAASLLCEMYFLSREKVPKSARGNRKSRDSPGPRRGSSRSGERLHRLAALVAEDSFEFPLDAEGILCKVAARDLLEVSVQPLGAEGTVFSLPLWGRWIRT